MLIYLISTVSLWSCLWALQRYGKVRIKEDVGFILLPITMLFTIIGFLTAPLVYSLRMGWRWWEHWGCNECRKSQDETQKTKHH